MVSYPCEPQLKGPNHGKSMASYPHEPQLKSPPPSSRRRPATILATRQTGGHGISGGSPSGQGVGDHSGLGAEVYQAARRGSLARAVSTGA
eukprot:365396-Chlamydomonas_euryale.AAC.19